MLPNPLASRRCTTNLNGKQLDCSSFKRKHMQRPDCLIAWHTFYPGRNIFFIIHAIKHFFSHSIERHTNKMKKIELKWCPLQNQHTPGDIQVSGQQLQYSVTLQHDTNTLDSNHANNKISSLYSCFTYAFLFHLISLCRSFTDRDSRHGLSSFFGKISPSESFRGARVVTVAIVGLEPDSET